MIYKRTGLYPFLTSSICDSVTAATSCFLVISSDNSLLDDKTSIAVSSSKMLPYKTRLLMLRIFSYLIFLMNYDQGKSVATRTPYTDSVPFGYYSSFTKLGTVTYLRRG